MADHVFYDVDLTAIDDLPRHLRNCAVLHGGAEITLNEHQSLQLARRIENGRTPRSAAEPVTRTIEVPAEPSRFEILYWTFGIAMAVQATLHDVLTALIGWLA